MERPTQLSAEARQRLLRRILASDSFRRSKRLSDFLTFVVDAEVAGSADAVSEQLIGQQLYGKQAGYNAAEENIVRVDARRLRQALESYFREEGSAESIRLDIPKGHYVPRYYTKRNQDPVHQDQDPPDSTPSARFPAPLQRRHVISGLLGIGLGFLVGAVLPRFLPGPSSPQTERSSSNPLLAMLDDPDRDTLVVVPDSILALMSYLTKKSLSLSDYLESGRLWSRSFPEHWRAVEQEMTHIAGRQYTNLSSIHFVSKFMRMQGPTAARTHVRFARNLQTRDFPNNHVVLLGSERANPWVQLFDDNFQFTFEFDPNLMRPLFRNRNPRKDEKTIYRAGDQYQEGAEIFAHIAAVPNVSGSGQVLIIEGTYMEGTEAGGAFVLDEQRIAEVIGLGDSIEGPLEFEVLLRSTAYAGGPSAPEIVALRGREADRLQQRVAR